MKTEYATLDQLYKTGLLSQYTYLDLRNSLQIERDSCQETPFKNEDFIHSGESYFKKMEMWILRELREKNWASGFLSTYQRARLVQNIQRDIADMLMAQAVIQLVKQGDDPEQAENAQLLALYQQRFDKRKSQLALLRGNFDQFYTGVEKELFSRAAFVAAQNYADLEFQHGEIGIKAYNRISTHNSSGTGQVSGF